MYLRYLIEHQLCNKCVLNSPCSWESPVFCASKAYKISRFKLTLLTLCFFKVFSKSHWMHFIIIIIIINNNNKLIHIIRIRGADPGFFLGGGALVSYSTSTPINDIVFLQNTSCIRKPTVISGGGVLTPCTLPLDPPLNQCIDIYGIHWDFWLNFFLTLCDFLEFWIGKGFCWSFVLILMFSFHEYFTDVLWAAFFKILIKYIDYYYYYYYYCCCCCCCVVVVIVQFFRGSIFICHQSALQNNLGLSRTWNHVESS